MPTLTQFGYCHKCDERVELVPTSTRALMCHKCGSIDIE